LYLAPARPKQRYATNKKPNLATGFLYSK
jgi:hypothetical protein